MTMTLKRMWNVDYYHHRRYRRCRRRRHHPMMTYSQLTFRVHLQRAGTELIIVFVCHFVCLFLPFCTFFFAFVTSTSSIICFALLCFQFSHWIEFNAHCLASHRRGRSFCSTLIKRIFQQVFCGWLPRPLPILRSLCFLQCSVFHQSQKRCNNFMLLSVHTVIFSRLLIEYAF